LASAAKPDNFGESGASDISAFGVGEIVRPGLRWAAVAALFLLVGLSRPAAAQLPVTIDEFKVGILSHDVGFLGHHVESGADVNLEMLFTPTEAFAGGLKAIGSPRPMIGASINTDGNTSDGYFGLTWGIRLIQSLFGYGDSVYLNGSLGGAVQDGYEDHAPSDRKRLGSPILFRESLELGYQVTPKVSVSAFLEHMSNANLAPRNAGITSAGARLGFKF
jgi:lipid A 3-O-deacylase